MYPGKDPFFGVFVKNQVRSLESIGIKVVKVVKNTQNRCAYVPFLLKSLFYLLFARYDLVHTHYGFHSALLPAIVKRTPLIITFHRGDALDEPYRSRAYFRLQRFVVSRADSLIAVSSQIKEALIRDLGARSDDVSVITCGVETSLFRPSNRTQSRQELGIPDHLNVVLHVGALDRRKGIDVLLECASRLQETLFILIGEGKIRANRDNCRFVGAQPNHRLPTWFNAADVFFLPSRSEGTPVAVLEALSCGIPVVASKVGGIPDVIRNGKTGYVVESEDIDAFEQRLRELLQSCEKRQQMGTEGRKDMMETYDNLKIALQIEQVYERVLCIS